MSMRYVERKGVRDICVERDGDICGERQKEVERGKEVYGVGGRKVDIGREGERERGRERGG